MADQVAELEARLAQATPPRDQLADRTLARRVVNRLAGRMTDQGSRARLG